MYLNWFVENHVFLRMNKNISVFEEAYNVLTERTSFSKNTAFGEMHPDGYLWIVKHEKIKILIEERQSHKYIYILDGNKFHIRALEYKYNYPKYRKYELKGLTETKFKEMDFKPHYEDLRDCGYILSIDLFNKICYGVNDRTINAINGIEDWLNYLRNPEKLNQ
jgi:hypothetical protein